jgi:3-deoxy-7-phosphoheptulonate synthase
MVVVMAPEATEADIAEIVGLVGAAGGEAFVSRGVSRTIIGLVGDVEQFGALNLRSYPGVTDVVRISVPYKLVSRASSAPVHDHRRRRPHRPRQCDRHRRALHGGDA